MDCSGPRLRLSGTVVLRHGRGRQWDQVRTLGPNLVVDAGKLKLAQYHIADATSSLRLSQIALGNGGAPNGLAVAPLPGDTALGFEILRDLNIDQRSAALAPTTPARADITYLNVFDARLVTDFGTKGQVVNEVGLFWSDGTLHARKTFDDLPFDPDLDHSLEIRWILALE